VLNPIVARRLQLKPSARPTDLDSNNSTRSRSKATCAMICAPFGFHAMRGQIRVVHSDPRIPGAIDDFLNSFPSATREQAIAALELAREAAGRER